MIDHQDERYIQDSITKMITLEQMPNPDWASVFQLGDALLDYIMTKGIGGDLDPYIIKFLDDSDIRSKDFSFGEYQRKRVRLALR